MNSREQPLFDTPIFHIELSDKLLYIYAPCVAVVRAWILAHRQIVFILKALHIRLADILKAGYKAGIYSDYSKDVIRPSAQECAQNGRARSTKMRWAVRAE